MEGQKRKTKTSSAVKNRYNSKVYSSIGVMLPKDLVAQFKEKCKASGISQAQVVKKAIEDFFERISKNKRKILGELLVRETRKKVKGTVAVCDSPFPFIRASQSMGYVQPKGSSTLPHWMPVKVS